MALSLALERLRRGQPEDLAARLRAIGEHCASLPDPDARNPDGMLGYDDIGMWR